MSLLAELARSTQAPAQAAGERCELCGAAIPGEHRHVADVQSRSLLCACRACTILLGRQGAGGGHYRLVPQRRALLAEFQLDEAQWTALQLPVDLAFFFHSTSAGRVVALYPSPLGATESQLELDAWEDVVRANPVLEGLERDVEALLVNRARGRREHYLVPIDDCYTLVAVIRSHWRGLAGGTEVWQEIERFFDDLHDRAEELR